MGKADGWINCNKAGVFFLIIIKKYRLPGWMQ